jgi:hypothetical protein
LRGARRWNDAHHDLAGPAAKMRYIRLPIAVEIGFQPANVPSGLEAY